MKISGLEARRKLTEVGHSLRAGDFKETVTLTTHDATLVFIRARIRRYQDWYLIWTEHSGYHCEHEDHVVSLHRGLTIRNPILDVDHKVDYSSSDEEDTFDEEGTRNVVNDILSPSEPPEKLRKLLSVRHGGQDPHIERIAYLEQGLRDLVAYHEKCSREDEGTAEAFMGPEAAVYRSRGFLHGSVAATARGLLTGSTKRKPT